MSDSRDSGSSGAGETARSLDRPLLIVLLATAVGYYVTWAIIASLLGKGFATWLATPLWGIPFFIVARWDRLRKEGEQGWWQRVTFPKLTRWIIGFVVCTILGVQTIGGMVLGGFLESARPELLETIPDNAGTLQALDLITDDTQVFILIVVAAVFSYFAAGYVGAKLATKKEFPVSHAAVGALIYSVGSYLIVGTLFWWDEIWEAPTEEDMGFIFLVIFMFTSISIFGAWFAVRERKRVLLSEMFRAPVKADELKPVGSAVSPPVAESAPAPAVTSAAAAAPVMTVVSKRAKKGRTRKGRR